MKITPKKMKKMLKESHSWSDFDHFDEVFGKYLPNVGEGNTMASQISTAICKLVYKWFNDGDVYDNSCYDGGGNDLSSFANWLRKYIPEANILAKIFNASTVADFDSFYVDLLYDVCVALEKVIDKYADTPAKGSVYNCDGAFSCEEGNDDDDDYMFESKRVTKESDGETTEQVDIPDSEWKKVFGYIDQGSDFKKVGTACKRNPDKLKSRYLILKALGLNDAADDFLRGADHYYWDEFENLPIPEIPAKYADKVADKAQLSKDYSKQQAKFAKRSMAGPLKELAQMGIEFFTLYPDGSGRNQQKAIDVLGFIPKWERGSTGLEFRNGRRWDVAQSIIMVNGETIKGDKWFEFVDHTNEGVDSPSYGYDVGFAGDWRVGAEEVGSNTVREWIRANVKLTGTDDSITSGGKFVINTPYNGISFTIDHDGFFLSKNLTDAEDSSVEESVRNIIFPKVKEIIKEKFGVENIGALSGVVVGVEIKKCIVDVGTGEFKTFDGKEGEITVGDRIGYDPDVTSLQMQAVKENNYYFDIDTIQKELNKASSEMRSRFVEPLRGKFINAVDAYRQYEYTTNGGMSILGKVTAWHDGSRRPNIKAMTDEKLAAYWYVCATRPEFSAEEEILKQALEGRGLRTMRARLTSNTSPLSESTKVTLTIGQIKKLVSESHEDPFRGSDEKDFDQVKRGDIAMRYDIPFVVLGKGLAKEIEDPDGSIASGIEEEWIDEDEPCVLVQSFYDGSKTSFVYGDAGVIVKDSFGNIKNIKL